MSGTALTTLLLLLAFNVVLFTATVHCLRDWIDKWQSHHALAIFIMVLSTVPCLLLPLDRARFGPATDGIVVLHESWEFLVWAVLFAIVPGALVAAATNAEPTRFRRQRSSTLLWVSIILGLLVGIALRDDAERPLASVMRSIQRLAPSTTKIWLRPSASSDAPSPSEASLMLIGPTWIGAPSRGSTAPAGR